MFSDNKHRINQPILYTKLHNGTRCRVGRARTNYDEKEWKKNWTKTGLSPIVSITLYFNVCPIQLAQCGLIDFARLLSNFMFIVFCSSNLPRKRWKAASQCQIIKRSALPPSVCNLTVKAVASSSQTHSGKRIFCQSEWSTWQNHDALATYQHVRGVQMNRDCTYHSRISSLVAQWAGTICISKALMSALRPVAAAQRESTSND